MMGGGNQKPSVAESLQMIQQMMNSPVDPKMVKDPKKVQEASIAASSSPVEDAFKRLRSIYPNIQDLLSSKGMPSPTAMTTSSADDPNFQF